GKRLRFLATASEMKFRMSSWTLAVLYVLFGVWLLFAVPRFRNLYSELRGPPHYLVKFVLAVSPFAWLTLVVLLAAAIVVKDLRFRFRFLNPLFTVFLFCGLELLLYGMFVAEFVEHETHPGPRVFRHGDTVRFTQDATDADLVLLRDMDGVRRVGIGK